MDYQIIGAFGAALLVSLEQWRSERKAKRESKQEDSRTLAFVVPPLLLTHDKSTGGGERPGDSCRD